MYHRSQEFFARWWKLSICEGIRFIFNNSSHQQLHWDLKAWMIKVLPEKLTPSFLLLVSNNQYMKTVQQFTLWVTQCCYLSFFSDSVHLFAKPFPLCIPKITFLYHVFRIIHPGVHNDLTALVCTNMNYVLSDDMQPTLTSSSLSLLSLRTCSVFRYAAATSLWASSSIKAVSRLLYGRLPISFISSSGNEIRPTASLMP